MFRSKLFFQKNRNIIFILIVFFITEIIINPIGEFCLNDDWAYAATVDTLMLENKFELGNWPAMTLIAHSLWGLLFAKIFGFSFTVLRLSVICLSLITVICAERFVFKLTNNPKASLMVAFLLLFNPLFLCLSNSYMTDVSFLCFVLLSLYFFYLFFEKGYLTYVYFAFLFALVSVFIRQIAVVIPLSFMFVALLQWPKSRLWKRVTILSFLFTGLMFSLLYFFEKHVLKTLTGEYGFQTLFHANKNLNFSFVTILEHFYVRLGLMFLYSGMFFFPILISNVSEIIRGVKAASISSKVIMSLFIALILFVYHYYPSGNYLYNWGIGTETLYDTMHLNVNTVKFQFNELYFIVIILSIVGNILLVAKMFTFNKPLYHSVKNLKTQPILFFLCLILGLYVLLLSLPLSFFDRYSLCFFLLCVIIIFIKFPELIIKPKMATCFLIIYAFFSVIGVVDYFNFNLVKTELLNDLIIEKKIPKDQINGGFEFDMYNSYISDTKSAYWDDRKEYIISFNEIDGYSKWDYKSYFPCIPNRGDTLFVLKKNAD